MTFERDPRGSRPVLQPRRRGALAPTLVVLGVLVVLGLLLTQIITDLLWFGQLGFAEVYRTRLLTQGLLFAMGALVMGVAVGSSLLIGYRSRPIYAPVSTEQAGLDRYRDSIEPLRRLVAVLVPLGLGLFAGSAASQQWEQALLWLNRVPFGSDDAQFGTDIGFFVFTLPWLQFVVGFLSAVVFLAGLAAVVTHYLYGGLRLQGAGQRLTSAARIHLFALAAAFLALRGLEYWLGRYALTTRDSRLITGLTYTDANAVLTARTVLSAIAFLIAVLFVVAAVVERFRLLPIFGVALLVVSAIVVGGIYPAGVQRFQVRPNELARESEYIERNIQATRDAYGLTGIEVQPFSATTEATTEALRRDADTIPGIRLLDPALVSDTFRQLQQIRPYYSFPDSLDVDRYTIDGQVRDAVVALREVDLEQPELASQRNWVNDHVVYTHGFGVVAAFGNQRSARGEPVFFQRNVPVEGEIGQEYEPRIYFGERSPTYSIVGAPEGARPVELDYSDGSENQQRNTTYAGEGGVAIGSLFRRVLYAIKFREQNILLSGSVNAESRILYDRNPRERVSQVAPFLTLDGDPYPTVADGRIKWVIDAYTTSDRYPYSRSQLLEDATSDSLTASTNSVVALQAQRVNYMRNSVKAVVDAYDGSVTLYAWDEEDPILRAWRKVFPDAVRPLADISGDLMSHLRYPEDLFKVQRQLLQTYHVTNAESYFSQQDFWTVPNDPTRSTGQLQPPYYLTLQMPGTDEPRFSLTSTFIPRGGTRNVLTGFLAVDADAGNTKGERREGYGTMRLLQLPRDTSVSGPGQVQNDFNADPDVAQVVNILERGGTQVRRGNLLTLPLGGGLLYVQPIYVEGTASTAYPLLQRVLVAFGDEIGFAENLDGALNQVFGTGAAPTTPAPGGTPAPGATPAPSAPADADAAARAALQRATDAIRDSQEALRDNDFAAYGQAQERLRAAVQEAQEALGRIAETAPTPAATPTGSG